MSYGAGSALSNRAIFVAATEQRDAQARRDFLNQACGADTRRREQIERLLQAHDARAPSALDRVLQRFEPLDTVAGGDRPTSGQSSPHPTIDRYQLLEPLGEGGMGLVYMAQQTHPVRRTVALKLIKPGMDSRDVIARFEAERQALAMMDHPNIARVFDAGTSQEGRPYFVMELVRGVPITEYCDQERLSLEDRLRLFVDVCHAVQHAHQKGIIHRDLKPSNVLVTMQEEVPVPKVIDFGVAKAIHQNLTERTLLTCFPQLIGTPLYMSPEQADMKGLDVDTRSDIYSLGVLLYELLTGRTPFEKDQLCSAGPEGMRRMILEQDPPPPSSRLSRLGGDDLTSVSEHRRIDPRRLRMTLRGELDWIVMRALERERSARYESASALADDVQSYLRDEPVRACPPTTAYRLRKFVRRRKRVMASAVMIAAALVAGTAVATWQAVRAHKQSVRANWTAARMTELAQEMFQKTEQAEFSRLRAEEAEMSQGELAERMENMLYAFQIGFAFQHRQMGDDEQAKVLLESWPQEDSGRDPRGIEWWLLKGMLHIPHEPLLCLPIDVSSVRVAPGGEYVVSATDGGVVYRHNLVTGRAMEDWETGLSDVRRIEFRPDGLLVAVISYDGEVAVLDTATGATRMRVPRIHPSVDLADVCFVGDSLFTTGDGGVISVWDIERGTQTAKWNLGGRRIRDLEAVPDQGMLLALVDDSMGWTVRFVSSVDGQPTREPLRLHYSPSALAVRPDARELAIGGLQGEVELWDLPRKERVGELRVTEKINELAYSRDGLKLAAAERTGVVHVWRLDEMHKAPEDRGARAHVHWQAHPRPARSVAFLADSSQLVSAGFDGRILRWDWAEPLTRRISTPDRHWAFPQMLERSGQVAVVDYRAVCLFDPRTGQLTAERALGNHQVGYERYLVSDESGGWLALGVETEPILCGSVEAGGGLEGLSPLPAAEFAAGAILQFVPGTDMLLCIDSSPYMRIRAWNFRHRRLLFDHSLYHIHPYGHAVVREGERTHLLTWTADAMLRIDPEQPYEAERFPVPGLDIACSAVSADGALVAVGRKDRSVTLMNAGDGQTSGTLLRHLASPDQVQFSPDSRTLLALDQRGGVRFWHVPSRTELMTWDDGDEITGFDLAADGSWMVLVREGELEMVEVGVPPAWPTRTPTAAAPSRPTDSPKR